MHDLVLDEPTEASVAARSPGFLQKFEVLLHSERENLPLLVPVAIGCGISIWQYAGANIGTSIFLACLGLVLTGLAFGADSLLGRIVIVGTLLLLAGFTSISFKSAVFGAEPIEKAWIGEIIGLVQRVEPVSSRDLVRYRVMTSGKEIPRIIRVNVESEAAPTDVSAGAVISVRVRLLPPPAPALPGGYDFARSAWFDGIGATGRAIGPVRLLTTADYQHDFWGTARNLLATRIENAMGEATGPVGAALLVGARGSINETDAEALRNSGMAHLLSVSGLHVTAVVGGSYLLLAGLLALIPWLVLRCPVPLIAAAGSALVAIGYTLLTGSEVPTIRACVAALLILLALAIGRDALSLRLLAAGATFVLLLWPEALAGPSFQLSFAAVATIIILHDNPRLQLWARSADLSFRQRLLRRTAMLFLMGLAIELVLAPIALFHFHKSGLYGALANMIAIPLTTFVIMPAQVVGLVGDAIFDGFGVPFWWLSKLGISGILWLAHFVSSVPGAVVLLPEMPNWAFATAILSALFVIIFRARWRWLALLPMFASLAAIILSPRPDMLLTGDGKHLAIVGDNGELVMLRARAGDYVRSILSETAAVGSEAIIIDDVEGVQCSVDSCGFVLNRGGRSWRILALRSQYMIPAMELSAACNRSDIVISSRRLPWSCKPAWLKADAGFLERSGGLAFYLEDERVKNVAEENAHLPWSVYSSDRLAEKVERRTKEKAARKSSPPEILPNKPRQ